MHQNTRCLVRDRLRNLGIEMKSSLAQKGLRSSDSFFVSSLTRAPPGATTHLELAERIEARARGKFQSRDAGGHGTLGQGVHRTVNGPWPIPVFRLTSLTTGTTHGS